MSQQQKCSLCGRALTALEIEYYGATCEICEGELHMLMSQAELDALCTTPCTTAIP